MKINEIIIVLLTVFLSSIIFAEDVQNEKPETVTLVGFINVEKENNKVTKIIFKGDKEHIIKYDTKGKSLINYNNKCIEISGEFVTENEIKVLKVKTSKIKYDELIGKMEVTIDPKGKVTAANIKSEDGKTYKICLESYTKSIVKKFKGEKVKLYGYAIDRDITSKSNTPEKGWFKLVRCSKTK